MFVFVYNLCGGGSRSGVAQDLDVISKISFSYNLEVLCIGQRVCGAEQERGAALIAKSKRRIVVVSCLWRAAGVGGSWMDLDLEVISNISYEQPRRPLK